MGWPNLNPNPDPNPSPKPQSRPLTLTLTRHRRLGSVQTRELLGFLHGAYRAPCYLWPCWLCVRAALLVLIAAPPRVFDVELELLDSEGVLLLLRRCFARERAVGLLDARERGVRLGGGRDAERREGRLTRERTAAAPPPLRPETVLGRGGGMAACEAIPHCTAARWHLGSKG